MLDLKSLKTMDNLEPYQGFYDLYEYGAKEKHFLHHATVSVLFVVLNIVKLSI